MPCSGAMHSYLVHELYGSTCRGLKSINQFQIIPEASETVCQKKNSDPKNCTIENFRLKKKNNYYGGGRKGDVRCEPCSLLPACSDWVQRLIYSFCIHSRSLEPPTRTYLFFFFHSGIHHAVDTHAALRKYVPYLSCASLFFLISGGFLSRRRFLAMTRCVPIYIHRARFAHRSHGATGSAVNVNFTSPGISTALHRASIKHFFKYKYYAGGARGTTEGRAACAA